MRILSLIIALCSFIALSAQSINILDATQVYDDVKGKVVNISGDSELHLNGEDPINGATFNINGDNVWIFIHSERPSYLKERLSQFTVNGSVAVDDDNVRVHQYEMGTVLISQDNDYIGATLFAETNFAGDALTLKHHTIYKDAAGLGAFNNAVSSFKLKKGYMMTIAQQGNGMGYSLNYVADKEDVLVSELPVALDNEVSFVRVVRWNWPSKKGINNVDKHGYAVEATWSYSWSAGAQSRDNFEFVPMKWQGGDVSNYYFTTKNITHQLAFNEPSHDEQSNMSVEAALREYPKLLATGLRAGSPNIADNGKPWLWEFMAKADELNYRIDFVGVHWYKGCQSAKQFYTWIKDVHDRTGRPIWITEFNNGASWTNSCEIPTLEGQADKIATFLHMFDTCSFVERYCIFPWVGETRHIMPNNGADSTLYPSGEVYRDQPSPFAYTGAVGFIPTYVEIPAPTSITVVKADDGALNFTWYENAYKEDGFSIERSFDGGAFVEIATVTGEQSYQVTYTDDTRQAYGEYRYRIRTMKGGQYSAYSDVISSVLDDGVYDIVYIQHNESGKKLRAVEWGVAMAEASATGADVQWIVISADEGYSFIENVGLSRRLHNGDSLPNLVENKWTGGNVQWALGDAGSDYYFLTNKSKNERIFTKSDNLNVTFVPTNYTGTKVQWQFVKSGLKYGETAIRESAVKTYSVHPNPSKDIVYINGLDAMTEVKVMDVSGRTLITYQTAGSIDVSPLKAGMYLLRIDDTQTFQIIKE